MKKNILKYTIAILLSVSFMACEDWLEESNPNQSDSESFWNNLEQTDYTLNSVYASLLSHYVLNIKEEAYRSDMAVPGFGRPNYGETGAQWNFQLYTNTDISIYNKWESLYLGIFRANQTIAGLEKCKDSVDPDAWAIQMGQARFFRGLFHFYLHSDFNKGSVIIRDFVPSTTEEYNKALSPSEDVIKFFREDLKYAYETLPTIYEDAKDKYRVTRGTAATILGTSFLYENEIDSAVVMFEDICNINNVDGEKSYAYELVQDTLLLFTTAGENNNESIFEIEYTTALKPELNTWVEDRLTNRLASDSWSNTTSSFFPSCWMIWEYLNEEMDPLDTRNYDVTSTMRDVSLRGSAMVALFQDENSLYYGKPAVYSGKAPFSYDNGFSRYKKYTNHDILSDENDNPGGRNHSGKNITVNRLADVYLMLAECYIYQNKIDEALKLINDVRSRWGLIRLGLSNGDTQYTYNEVAYDDQSLLERLQEIEKPLEMSIEGHSIRWIDLRRWGKLESNFEKRAAETFWTADYAPKDGSKVKWNSTITKIDPNDPNKAVAKDFEQAAINFKYDLHAWLPIPSTEIVSNPGLYGN